MTRATFGILVACALVFAPGLATASPEQLHVTLAQEGADLVVQWVVKTPYSVTDSPRLEWASGDDPVQSAFATLAGATQWYWPTDPASQPADFDTGPSFTYAAVVPSPPRGATLVYRVGSDAAGWSEARDLRVPPGADRPVRFIAVGDIGYTGVRDDGSHLADSPPGYGRTAALREDPDLVIIPGDLAYDNSNRGWDRFFRFMEPLAAHVPMLPAPGNHDMFATHYAQRFVLPEDEHNYLFRAGPVTFISLDSTEVCYGDQIGAAPAVPPCGRGVLNGRARAWLESALILARDDETAWTVVFFHYPAYSFTRYPNDENVLGAWVPLFEAYDVDLVITGHAHDYSRTHPIREGGRASAANGSYAQGEGPIYVVAGGGGRRLYSIPDGTAPEWLADARAVFNVVRVDARPEKLEVTAIDSITGAYFDTFEVLRGGAAREPRAAAESDRVSETPGLALALIVSVVSIMARLGASRRGPGSRP